MKLPDGYMEWFADWCYEQIQNATGKEVEELTEQERLAIVCAAGCKMYIYQDAAGNLRAMSANRCGIIKTEDGFAVHEAKPETLH